MVSSPTNYGDVGCLPEELIGEIFLKLPIKTLARFLTLCKEWYDMIKNPRFTKSNYIQQLLAHNPPLPSLLLFRSDDYIFSLDINSSLDQNLGDTAGHAKGKFIPFSPPSLTGASVRREYGSFIPLGTCHGIICIHVGGANDIRLWNPHTKQIRSVGLPPVKSASFTFRCSGFGFVPAINDYKIVLVVGERDQEKQDWNQIFMYSLRANCWRELDISTMGVPVKELRTRSRPSPCWGRVEVLKSVRVKDALYWIAPKDEKFYLLLKFDLINDSFVEETFISEKKEKGYPASIGNVGDSKLCVCLFTYGPPSKARTCVMERCPNNEAKWKSLVEIEGDWSTLGDDHKVLGIACNGNVLVMEKRKTTFEHMLIVDGRQQQQQQQQQQPKYIRLHNEYVAPYERGNNMSYLMCYVPSLVSPFSL